MVRKKSILLSYDYVKAISDINSTSKPSKCVIKSDTFLIIINLFGTGKHAVSVSLMVLESLI